MRHTDERPTGPPLGPLRRRATTPYMIRPVNLRTDLAQLADLIEVAFADSMDAHGRNAVREMRDFSRLSFLFPPTSDTVMGMGMGYVWVEDAKVVGNVSIYPSEMPDESGSVWIIANVSVLPAYRGRGIAKKLMRACMETIQSRRGDVAILQVESQNDAARSLYEQLGFLYEREWTFWRRSASIHRPPLLHAAAEGLFISHRRDAQWRDEYALAQHARPNEHGGLGWQRPLLERYFRPSLWRTLRHWLMLRNTERLHVRQAQRLTAALWLETSVNNPQLTLFTEPDHDGVAAEALMSNIIHRMGASTLLLEHPADDLVTNALLEHYRFSNYRTVFNMRWESAQD
jgi:ribosomal protein S18 acetylase RimI-like enzyme